MLKESGPRSAAKQGRSLCLVPLKEELWESMWAFSGGHILEKGPPDIGQECAPNPLSYDKI